MKQYLSALIAIVFSWETSFAQVVCQQVVGEDKVQKTTQKAISKDEAAELALQFVNKKMLAGNIQQAALILSHQTVINDPYGESYNQNRIDINSDDFYHKQQAIRKLLRKYNIKEHYKKKHEVGADIDKIINQDQAFNEADVLFIQSWQQRSILVLERMDLILDMPQDERTKLLNSISVSFNNKDSQDELIQALLEIRKLRNTEPEQYEIFKQAWIATLPVAAKTGQKNTKLFFDGESASAVTFIGTAITSMTSLLYFFGVNEATVVAGGFGTLIGSGVLTSAVSDSNPVTALERKLRSMTIKGAKAFIRARVIKLAKEKLNLSEAKAVAVVDENTSQERSMLDQLQDKTREELLEILKQTDEGQFSTPEQLSRYQVLQMQLMTQISNQFSVLSERQENIRTQTDKFIQEAEQLAQMKESEKRTKVAEISALHKDAIEFSLDVNSLKKLNEEAYDQITLNMTIISSLMKNEKISRESKALMEQLLTQSAIMDGMREALSILSNKTEQDAEMITKLSLGIMAGRVTNLMKTIRNGEPQ